MTHNKNIIKTSRKKRCLAVLRYLIFIIKYPTHKRMYFNIDTYFLNVILLFTLYTNGKNLNSIKINLLQKFIQLYIAE